MEKSLILTKILLTSFLINKLIRETRDGCDGCPGPNGGFRNRTAEEILTNNIPNNRWAHNNK